MSVGDITWFDEALLNLGKKIFDFANDAIKVGIIKSAANGGVDPAVTTADPRWGAGGTTNLASSQVATAGTAYTAPITLTSVTWTNVSGTPTLRAAEPTINQDASGFTNGRWAIFYDDTDSGKRAIAYMDLGADRDITLGSLTLAWSGATNDILTLNQG
jgi:hypothetical protein